MLSSELVIWTFTGAETTTCGICAITSATLIDAPAGLIPTKLLIVLGRMKISLPMPSWRSLKPLSLPIRMAVMERIMMTSIAIARQLMSERNGRWTRLPTTNLFIHLLVYGSEAAAAPPLTASPPTVAQVASAQEHCEPSEHGGSGCLQAR